MESVKDIKEALSARSRTATLDELRSEGRKRVRVIRAEHIAQMVSEAVNAAVEQSGLVAPEEVQRLVDKSRQEFRSILKEREQEVEHAREVESTLADRDSQLNQLKEQLAHAAAEMTRMQAEIEGLRNAYSVPAAAPAATGAAPSGDLLMSMVQEMANLKASLMHRDAQERAPSAPAASGAADFTAAIEKLSGTLNDRIEKIGKKMGVSAAVESDAPLDFGNLFKDDGGKTLESNMDNIEVKQKSGGGIAANLARLKKLKGGK
ncbi:MAG: hypothetical protein JNK78_11535 [Planctomycetes bacterium]|nr:hypothetical protein [Planctomycetota bacterium]